MITECPNCKIKFDFNKENIKEEIGLSKGKILTGDEGEFIKDKRGFCYCYQEDGWIIHNKHELIEDFKIKTIDCPCCGFKIVFGAYYSYKGEYVECNEFFGKLEINPNQWIDKNIILSKTSNKIIGKAKERRLSGW